ncbi:hypothetical protein REC12_11370 [Desulfosporosinus sp. PR]|uniref:hypothetical protein n=1 Tax=Candidatus Desulfosporosinus nitrosoreducens TaxID=3401928 RepID=UPI0027EC90FF|nr:hypothetical protein [Desulfosporosinus sp. PR]MDQ7094189.1 hypothetical protein [Desulfosporosinus sp. PR]
MSEAKFTPGPWILEETDEGHSILMGEAISDRSQFPSHCEINYEHGCFLDGEEGDVFSPEVIKQAEEALANAYLITAALEMYEALKKANLFITNGIKYGYITMPDPKLGDSASKTPEIIRKALIKAQGGELSE